MIVALGAPVHLGSIVDLLIFPKIVEISVGLVEYSAMSRKIEKYTIFEIS